MWLQPAGGCNCSELVDWGVRQFSAVLMGTLAQDVQCSTSDFDFWQENMIIWLRIICNCWWEIWLFFFKGALHSFGEEILRDIYFFNNWITSGSQRKIRSPENSLKLEWWQGPPHVNREDLSLLISDCTVVLLWFVLRKKHQVYPRINFTKVASGPLNEAKVVSKYKMCVWWVEHTSQERTIPPHNWFNWPTFQNKKKKERKKANCCILKAVIILQS